MPHMRPHTQLNCQIDARFASEIVLDVSPSNIIPSQQCAQIRIKAVRIVLVYNSHLNEDATPETDWGDEREIGREKVSRVRFWGPTEPSLVRMSPESAVIFPLFKLSLKTREERIVMKSGIRRLDFL